MKRSTRVTVTRARNVSSRTSSAKLNEVSSSSMCTEYLEVPLALESFRGSDVMDLLHSPRMNVPRSLRESSLSELDLHLFLSNLRDKRRSKRTFTPVNHTSGASLMLGSHRRILLTSPAIQPAASFADRTAARMSATTRRASATTACNSARSSASCRSRSSASSRVTAIPPPDRYRTSRRRCDARPTCSESAATQAPPAVVSRLPEPPAQHLQGEVTK